VEYATIEEAITKDGYRLAYKVAKEYHSLACSNGISADIHDVLQACMLGMWKRKDSYDKGRGGYTTWIRWAARGAATDWFRRELRWKRERSLSSETCSIADLHAVHEEPELYYGIFGELQRYITDSELAMLVKYYVQDLTLEQLDLSVTRERNRQRLVRTCQAIRRRIEAQAPVR
jgi:RNA polymerase sigma factor (sigma-70 family)